MLSVVYPQAAEAAVFYRDYFGAQIIATQDMVSQMGFMVGGPMLHSALLEIQGMNLIIKDFAPLAG